MVPVTVIPPRNSGLVPTFESRTGWAGLVVLMVWLENATVLALSEGEPLVVELEPPPPDNKVQTFVEVQPNRL